MELLLPKASPASGFRLPSITCSIPQLQGPAPPRETSHKQLMTGKRFSKYKAEEKHHHMCMGKESTACKPQVPPSRCSQGLRRDSKIQKITCYHHQQQISQVVTAYPGKAKFQVVLAAITSKNKVYQKNM